MYYKRIYVEGRKHERAEKGLLDMFIPHGVIDSPRFRNRVAQLDLRTCAECRANHGKVYDKYDIVDPKPPLHTRCRCAITRMRAIPAGMATKDGLNGADFRLKHYGSLPDCYISQEQLNALGWEYGDRPSKFAPGKMFGGLLYDNADRHLPRQIGRVWHEADINYSPGRRNRHRVVWSNDGLVFVTYDHYQTFFKSFKERTNMIKATIDLSGCKYLGEVHQRIKEALRFRDGYGEN